MASSNYFRSALEAHCQQLPEGERPTNPTAAGRVAALFYVREVYEKINPGRLPDDEEEISECHLDAAGDSLADFAYCADDGSVLIIQFVKAGHGKLADTAKFDRFCNIISRLAPESGQKFPKHERVRNFAQQVDWETARIELIYATTGRATAEIRAREERGIEPTKEFPDLDQRATVVFLEEKDLNDQLQEANSAIDQIDVPVPLQMMDCDGKAPWLTYEDEHGHKCWVGIIAGNQLSALYSNRRFGIKLFNNNIRNYIGSTIINKSIFDTCLNHPSDFFFFNNGVSCIATDVEEDLATRTLHCMRLSVVNGAQTVRSIHKAAGHKHDPIRKVAVLIRVTQVTYKDKPRESEFLQGVTKFNNKQNAIKVSDFLSVHPTQRDLAHRFDSLKLRSGKRIWYKNKRTRESKQNSVPIAMEEFVKSIFAFWVGPPDCFGGSEHVFSAEEGGGYCKVFGDGVHVWNGVTDSDFRWMAGTWFFCDAINTCLKAEKKKSPLERREALERKWLVYWTVQQLLRERYATVKTDQLDIRNELGKMYEPDSFSGREIGAAVNQYTIEACDVLRACYRSAKKQGGLVHRNWFRQESTLNDIREEMRDRQRMVENLPLLA